MSTYANVQCTGTRRNLCGCLPIFLIRSSDAGRGHSFATVILSVLKHLLKNKSSEQVASQLRAQRVVARA